MGLVNRVVPDAELEAYVKDYAETIAANAPLTVNAIKYIVGEVVKDETSAISSARRAGEAMLRQQGLRRGPHRLHGEAQAGVHRDLRDGPARRRANGAPLDRGATRRRQWHRSSCKGLTKRYGPLAVVDDVSLRIEHGRWSACSGPRAAARPRRCG